MSIIKNIAKLALVGLFSSAAYAADAPSTVAMSQVITNINNAGYPVVMNIEYDDGVYTAKALNVLANKVTVKVGNDGNIISPSSNKYDTNMADAAKNVEGQGYTIKEVTTTSSKYKFNVVNNEGKTQTVYVDLKTGAISN